MNKLNNKHLSLDKMSLQEDRIEKLADKQHEIWADWMKYMFNCGTYDNKGNWVMPEEKVKRWQRQMVTPYSELSEKEKQSDRDQVDKFIHLI